VSDGAFGAPARAAIYEAADQRCIGCGRPDLTAQHRRARGMGGTSEVSIGHPANGVALCGSGTVGCHGWTEHHPTEATLMGWRLEAGQPALGTPFWQRLYGWRAWAADDDDPMRPYVVYVDVDDLDRRDEREAALAFFQRDRLLLPA
jgi:hypothetical protein